MPFPKIAEVRELSDEELTAEIVKVKRELFDLRIEMSIDVGEIIYKIFPMIKVNSLISQFL